MLLWNDLHPYHAVHIVRVFAPLDLPRLGEAVKRTLAAAKLGRVILNPSRGTFCYEDGAANYELSTVQLGADPRADLALEAARQLKERFAHQQSFQPFRFFVAAEAETFYLGLVYFHALADGESVVKLLKSVVDAYSGREPVAGLDIYPRPCDGILFRDPALFFNTLRAMVAQIRTLRRARRIPCRDAQDPGNAVMFFSLAPDELPTLLLTAKAWDVTLNDLFLALLLKCLTAQLPEPQLASRRTKLAVGCIVNLRKELGLAGRRIFGLFLGSFVVTCEPRAELDLRELAREVREQTARIKADRLSVGTPLELHFARMLLRFFSLERRGKFYQKNYPLWGGLTNMNLDSIWQQPAGGRSVEYLRAVSTGPATPLGLSITTMGGGVSVGLSYRTACFSPVQAEGIKSCFLETIRKMQGPA